MSLIQTARLHGLDPHAYLRDVLERLPTTPASLKLIACSLFMFVHLSLVIYHHKRLFKSHG